MEYQDTKFGVIQGINADGTYNILLPNEDPPQIITNKTSIFPRDVYLKNMAVKVGYPQSGDPEIASRGIICNEVWWPTPWFYQNWGGTNWVKVSKSICLYGEGEVHFIFPQDETPGLIDDEYMYTNKGRRELTVLETLLPTPNIGNQESFMCKFNRREYQNDKLIIGIQDGKRYRVEKIRKRIGTLNNNYFKLIEKIIYYIDDYLADVTYTIEKDYDAMYGMRSHLHPYNADLHFDGGMIRAMITTPGQGSSFFTHYIYYQTMGIVPVTIEIIYTGGLWPANYYAVFNFWNDQTYGLYYSYYHPPTGVYYGLGKRLVHDNDCFGDEYAFLSYSYSNPATNFELHFKDSPISLSSQNLAIRSSYLVDFPRASDYSFSNCMNLDEKTVCSTNDYIVWVKYRECDFSIGKFVYNLLGRDYSQHFNEDQIVFLPFTSTDFRYYYTQMSKDEYEVEEPGPGQPSIWIEYDIELKIKKDQMVVTNDLVYYFVYEDHQNNKIGVLGIDLLEQSVHYHYQQDVENNQWPTIQKLFFYGDFIGFNAGDAWKIVRSKRQISNS
jgi:hypothetical protein